MSTSLVIRPFQPADAAPLAALFRDAVHALAAEAYTPAQRAAWAPPSPDASAWAARLEGATTLVAVCEGRPVGFLSFEADGHIDLLYTAPAFARQGVASRLYEAAEGRLSATGVTRLYAEASLVAEPFFARQGFRVVERQQVLRQGIELRRLLMAKTLRQRG